MGALARAHLQDSAWVPVSAPGPRDGPRRHHGRHEHQQRQVAASTTGAASTNEWTFVPVQRNLTAGGGGQGADTPGRGGRGGRGNQTPGRGGDGARPGSDSFRPGGGAGGGGFRPPPARSAASSHRAAGVRDLQTGSRTSLMTASWSARTPRESRCLSRAGACDRHGTTGDAGRSRRSEVPVKPARRTPMATSACRRTTSSAWCPTGARASWLGIPGRFATNRRSDASLNAPVRPSST